MFIDSFVDELEKIARLPRALRKPGVVPTSQYAQQRMAAHEQGKNIASGFNPKGQTGQMLQAASARSAATSALPKPTGSFASFAQQHAPQPKPSAAPQPVVPQPTQPAAAQPTQTASQEPAPKKSNRRTAYRKPAAQPTQSLGGKLMDSAISTAPWMAMQTGQDLIGHMRARREADRQRMATAGL